VPYEGTTVGVAQQKVIDALAVTWRSPADVAALTGMSRQQATNALRALANRGLIERERRGSHSKAPVFFRLAG